MAMPPPPIDSNTRQYFAGNNRTGGVVQQEPQIDPNTRTRAEAPSFIARQALIGNARILQTAEGATLAGRAAIGPVTVGGLTSLSAPFDSPKFIAEVLQCISRNQDFVLHIRSELNIRDRHPLVFAAQHRCYALIKLLVIFDQSCDVATLTQALSYVVTWPGNTPSEPLSESIVDSKSPFVLFACFLLDAGARVTSHKEQITKLIQAIVGHKGDLVLSPPPPLRREITLRLLPNIPNDTQGVGGESQTLDEMFRLSPEQKRWLDISFAQLTVTLWEDVNTLFVKSCLEVPSFPPHINRRLHLLFCEAYRNGDREIIRRYTGYGCNPQYVNSEEQSPLSCAVEGGHVSLIKELLENYPSYPHSKRVNLMEIALANSAALPHENIVQILVLLIKKHCPYPSVIISLLDSTKPLFAAIQRGYLPLTDAILRSDSTANINAVDSEGKTPLMAAIMQGHPKIAVFLVRSGANRAAYGNRSYLVAAVENEKSSCLIRDGIFRGIQLYAVDLPVFEKAAQVGRPDIMKEVALNNTPVSDPQSFPLDNSVPFRFAVSMGDEDLIRLLVRQGFTLDYKKEQARSILEMTVKKANPGCLIALLAIGVTDTSSFTTVLNSVLSNTLARSDLGSIFGNICFLLAAGAKIDLALTKPTAWPLLQQLIKLLINDPNESFSTSHKSGETTFQAEPYQQQRTLGFSEKRSFGKKKDLAKQGVVSIEELFALSLEKILEVRLSLAHIALTVWRYRQNHYLTSRQARIYECKRPDFELLLAGACAQHQVGLVKECLAVKDILINSCDRLGKTALHYTVERGHIDIMELLLEQGADVNGGTGDNLEYRLTPLLSALKAPMPNDRKVQIVSSLLRRNASIEFCGGYASPLYLAAESMPETIIKTILERGAKAHPMNRRTPIYAAARKKRWGIVCYLVSYKAIGDVTKVNGYSPLPVAVLAKEQNAVRMFLAMGYDPDHLAIHCKRGDMPVKIAIDNRDVELVRDLLAFSASPDGLPSKNNPILRGIGNSKIPVPEVDEHSSMPNPNSTTTNSELPTSKNHFQSAPTIQLKESLLYIAANNEDEHIVTLLLAAGSVITKEMIEDTKTMRGILLKIGFYLLRGVYNIGEQNIDPLIAAETHLIEAMPTFVENSQVSGFQTKIEGLFKTTPKELAKLQSAIDEIRLKLNTVRGQIQREWQGAVKDITKSTNLLPEDILQKQIEQISGLDEWTSWRERMATELEKYRRDNRMEIVRILLELLAFVEHRKEPAKLYRRIMADAQSKKVTSSENEIRKKFKEEKGIVVSYMENAISQLKSRMNAEEVGSTNEDAIKAVNSALRYYSGQVDAVLKCIKNGEVPRAVRMRGMGFKFRSLTGDNLAVIEKQVLRREKSPEQRSGSHIVFQYNKMHLKVDPYAPGVECKVYFLGPLFFQKGDGPPPTELIRLEFEDKTCFLQASLSIDGQNFENTIRRNPGNIPILPKSYTSNFLLGLAIKPGDWKPDNFIFVVGENKIYPFDNDISFVPELAKRTVFGDQGKHIPAVRNILFFLPQMDTSLDSSARDRFLSLNMEIELIDWLLKIQTKNEAYEQAKKDKIFTDDDYEKLKLPITFNQGEVRELYQRLVRMQQVIREFPNITHRELLKKINHALEGFYATIQNKSKDPLDALAAIWKDPRVEDVLEPSQMTSSDGMDYRTFMSMEDKKITEDKLPLKQATEELLATIDYSMLAEDLQRRLLGKLRRLPFVSLLTLRKVTVFKSFELLSVLEGMKALQHLVLIDCDPPLSPGSIGDIERMTRAKVTVKSTN